MSKKNIKYLLFKHFNDTGLKYGIFQAAGRVNIIGEHTDYNDGFVLPIAIDKRIWMAAQLRADQKLKIYSLDFEEKTEADLSNLKKDENYRWANYILAVLDQFQKEGDKLRGLNILFTGNIPLGAGLSSSAALEVVTTVMVSNLNNIKIDGVETALLCQRAENDFVGVASGIMDQYVSRLGQKDRALLIDCRTNDYYPVLFADNDYCFVISNTKANRELLDSEYNKRREECQQAVNFFAKKLSKEVRALRDVSFRDFKEYEEELFSLSENAAKRARHVITESNRALEAVKAIENRNFQLLADLMNKSHESLKDDYEVSCLELDLMVEISKNQEGVLASRMTGAGFGGCTVSLVHKDKTESFEENVKKLYKEKTGIEPDIYVSIPAEGAGIIESQVDPNEK